MLFSRAATFAFALVLTLAAAVVVVHPQGAAAPGQGAAGREGGAGRQGGGGGGGMALLPAIQWPSPPLPQGSVIKFESALPQHRQLQAVVVARGMSHPWSLAFLPDGNMLVTERGGKLRIIRKGVLDPTPVAGVPPVMAQAISGLMEIALHPRFAENRFLYLTYHKPVPNVPDGRGGTTTRRASVLARATWDGNALTGLRELFVTPGPGMADSSRLVFGRDGTLYMTLGTGTEGAASPSQKPDQYGGKIIRLRDDGTVPPDNPFVGMPGYKPEIYSLGHRNQLGLAINPETGDLWASEQGPNGGDEINIIHAGKNYGWPVTSFGRGYLGPRVSAKPVAEGMEDPIVVWVPSIALSGMTFYTGDKFPGWRHSVFVGGMQQGEIPRTGQLQRIEFNEKWEELRREPLLRELRQRIRDVRQGPDGYLYVLTEEEDGALLRIEPDVAAATR